MDLVLSRRGFIEASAALAGAGLILGASDAGAAGRWDEPADHERLRQAARRRKRRIIYNNDGCDIFSDGAKTPEGFLAQRFKHALDTQVDSIFYCTGVTTLFSHLAQVGETYGEFCHDDSGANAVNARENIRALKEAGHDTLKLAVEFCHGNQLEIIFSHRINDIHDTFVDWLLCRWKREHPEYLMGAREEAAKAGGGNSPRHWWSALDFERPEVLDYLIAIQEDVCRRYDIDGVEIDYFRSPMFFRPNLDYEPATDTQVTILTGFQRRLRELTIRLGAERTRPILMATRVPATREACRHVGIDIQAWLREDLLDLLTITGGYVPFTEPIEGVIALGHAHGVPVYPTISASGMRGRARSYGTVEAWRGAASNAWRKGADGIYIFNLFPSGPSTHFQQLGSPESLAGLDKLFVVDNARALEGVLVQGIEQSQALPLAVPADGTSVKALLPVGDDFRQTPPKELVLRVQLDKPPLVASLKVQINSHSLEPQSTDADGGWVTFQPPAHQFRPGDNAIEFALGGAQGEDGDATEVLAVELSVRYE